MNDNVMAIACTTDMDRAENKACVYCPANGKNGFDVILVVLCSNHLNFLKTRVLFCCSDLTVLESASISCSYTAEHSVGMPIVHETALVRAELERVSEITRLRHAQRSSGTKTRIIYY